jgi:hypothetical protein
MCAADTGATPPTSQSVLAALKRRALRILTPRPVVCATFVRHTSQKQSGAGCKGGMTSACLSLRQNIGTRTTGELILARAPKATTKGLRGLYLRQHMTLSKGDLTCE